MAAGHTTRAIRFKNLGVCTGSTVDLVDWHSAWGCDETIINSLLETPSLTKLKSPYSCVIEGKCIPLFKQHLNNAVAILVSGKEVGMFEYHGSTGSGLVPTSYYRTETTSFKVALKKLLAQSSINAPHVYCDPELLTNNIDTALSLGFRVFIDVLNPGFCNETENYNFKFDNLTYYTIRKDRRYGRFVIPSNLDKEKIEAFKFEYKIGSKVAGFEVGSEPFFYGESLVAELKNHTRLLDIYTLSLHN